MFKNVTKHNKHHKASCPNIFHFISIWTRSLTVIFAKFSSSYVDLLCWLLLTRVFRITLPTPRLIGQYSPPNPLSAVSWTAVGRIIREETRAHRPENVQGDAVKYDQFPPKKITKDTA